MYTYVIVLKYVHIIYRYYRLQAILWVMLVCLPCLLWGQRAKAISVKADEWLGRAQKAYASYHFVEASQALEAYQTALQKARKPISEEASALMLQVEQAEKALRYAEQTLLVDSLSFPAERLEEVLGELSPYLAAILKPRGGDLYSLGYHAPIGGRGYVNHITERGDRDLLRLDSLHGLREIEVEFLGEGVNSPNDEVSPFVLPDGLVLFFARRSAEGLGGYDLYWSRYSVDRGQYYAATALGMPYNSLANDYLLAYDDREDMCYLLSDRFQSPGHLVLYRLKGLPQAMGRRSDAGQEGEQSIESLRMRALLQGPALQSSPLSERYQSREVETVVLEHQPNTNTEDKM